MMPDGIWKGFRQQKESYCADMILLSDKANYWADTQHTFSQG